MAEIVITLLSNTRILSADRGVTRLPAKTYDGELLTTTPTLSILDVHGCPGYTFSNRVFLINFKGAQTVLVT